MPAGRVSRTARSLSFAILLTPGCASDSESDADDGADDGADGSSGGGMSSGAVEDGGTVTLSFSVSNGARANPNLMDPLMGPIYGEVFASIDVTITGPVEGAMSYGSIAIEAVDLTMADSVAGTWTSDPLAPGEYVFLGAFDIDDNADEFGGQPDTGDPVTLPNQKFDIVAGEDTPFTVAFDLIYS
jgi:hypothetical protein